MEDKDKRKESLGPNFQWKLVKSEKTWEEEWF